MVDAGGGSSIRSWSSGAATGSFVLPEREPTHRLHRRGGGNERRLVRAAALRM